jgi:hypothetical protein
MKLSTLHFAVLSVLSATSAQAETTAHYRFETAELNSPLMRLLDSSGRGHHGRVIGREPFEVTTDTPPFKDMTQSALDARGRDDYAIIPHHQDFAPEGDWTIEFFFKPTTFHQELGGATNIAGNFTFLNGNLSYAILAKPVTTQPTVYGSAWAFHYQPANGHVVATISYGTDKGETLLAGKDMRDGQWHHIAMVLRTSIENEVSLYVDGFLNTSVNQHGGNRPISFGEEPIYVGAFSRQTTQFTEKDRNFDGFIDEVRFSDIALGSDGFLADLSLKEVDVEIHRAVELRFPTGKAELYRVEWSQDGQAWNELGHVLGDGNEKSFHHRDEVPGQQYRLVPDAQKPGEPAPNAVPVVVYQAAEIRFPTDNGQLYRITWTSDLTGDEVEATFVLGNGGKKSFYDRVSDADRRFYHVNRY